MILTCNRVVVVRAAVQRHAIYDDADEDKMMVGLQ